MIIFVRQMWQFIFFYESFEKKSNNISKYPLIFDKKSSIKFLPISLETHCI